MYCPNCELEIKGEDKKECPICGAELVENPFDGAGQEIEGSDDDLKLKELIDDIDSKVQKNLEESIDAEEPPFPELRFDDELAPEGVADVSEPQGESGDESALTLDVSVEAASEKTPEEPESLDAILDELQNEAGAMQSELDRSLDAIVVPGEDATKQPGADEVPPDVEAPPDVVEETTSGVEEIPVAVDDTPPVVDEPVPAADTEETVAEPVPQAAAAAGEDGPAEEPQAEEERPEVPSAREVLDKALDELDQNFQPGHREKRSAAGPIVLVLLVALLAGAGGYYVYETYLRPEGAEQQAGTDAAPPAVGHTEQGLAATAGDSTAPEQPAKPIEKQSAAADRAERAPRDVAPNTPQAEGTPVRAAVPSAAAPAPPASKPAQPPATAKPARTAAAPEKQTAAPAEPDQQRPYSIHAGSYRKQNVARSEVSRLGALGFVTYVQQVDLGNKGVWYRVKIGDFATRAEAETVLGTLKKKASVPARILPQKE